MKPKKTLLVLTSTYPRWLNDPEPGFVHELSKRLTEQFRVIVLAPHAPGAKIRETMDGVEVVRYRYAPERWETLVNDGGIVSNLKHAKWKLLLIPSFVLSQAWQTWCLIRREKVDLIHTHWLIPQGLIAASLQYFFRKKVPFVVTSHGADLYALKGRVLDTLKRFVAGKAAAATVVSTSMRERLKSIGADVSKVSVLPMGVDMAERFAPDASAKRSASEILFVGRLVEKKGVRYLIQALPHVLLQRPDAFLTIAGFGPDEPALREQVRSAGLDDKVRFLGAVPQAQLPTLYQRATVFVAPFVRASSGDEEGLGLVLVEAIACECPVLVGDVDAVKEVLGSNAKGTVLDPRDTATMSARILQVLAQPEQARYHASQLRTHLGARFNWVQVASKYAQLLTETAAGR